MYSPITGRDLSSGARPPAPGVLQDDWHAERSENLHLTPNRSAMPLAKFLGWFSIGLGVAQLLAPRRMSNATGIRQQPVLMRSLGMREIASGIGILSQKQPSPWLWARVAGDGMDLALLGIAATSKRSQRHRIAIAAAAVAGVMALDILGSVQQSRRERKQGPLEDSDDLYVETALAINKSPQECYGFWRNFENFPRFMEHLESVQVLPGNRSHWKARGPAGRSIEWDAEITADQPGELLAWHSLPGAEVENAGTVRFERAPGGRGTIVRVELQYSPPGGVAGAVIASLFNEEPSQQIADDLRRFKWLIEAGEIPTTIGQPAGTRSALANLFRKGLPG